MYKIFDLLVHERMKLHFYATIYYFVTKDNSSVKDLCSLQFCLITKQYFESVL